MEPALSFLGTINLITIFLWPILKQLCSSGPLAELIQDEDVKEKLLEAARTFFTSSTVTVNLLPAALAAGAALLLAIPLLALLFPGLLEGLLGGGGGSDTVSSGYGAPATGYGAPESSYGAPSSSYESQYRSVSLTCRSHLYKDQNYSTCTILTSPDIFPGRSVRGVSIPAK